MKVDFSAGTCVYIYISDATADAAFSFQWCLLKLKWISFVNNDFQIDCLYHYCPSTGWLLLKQGWIMSFNNMASNKLPCKFFFYHVISTLSLPLHNSDNVEWTICSVITIIVESTIFICNVQSTISRSCEGREIIFFPCMKSGRHQWQEPDTLVFIDLPLWFLQVKNIFP